MAAAEKKLILLIDDDTSLVLTLSDFLMHEGYDVVTANSGENGLKKLKEVSPDLIILDMSMPGMGGVGFLKEITREQGKPSHPVLVLTARANMADFFANVEVDGFIAKPCDPNDLLMEAGRIIFLRSSEKSRTAAGNATAGGSRRVLLAEDDREVRSTLRTAFEQAGHELVVVASGPEVLERAVVEKPDVIVIKRILENMNGDTVAELLHKMPGTRQIPIVLYDSDLAGNRNHQDFERAGIGVAQFVRSHDAEHLLSAVRRVLRER
jgi:CheY-like chemotaxis protein